MSGDLGSLVISLTAETAQFKDSMTKAAYQMDQNVGQMVGSMNSLQSSLATVDSHLANFGINLRNVLGLAAAGGFAELISGSIESAAKMQLLSEKSGILTGELAAMKAAARAGGTDLESVAQASEKFSKNIETNSPKAALALDALGLSMEDVKTHSPAEQMHLVAQRLNDFAEGSGKAAAAQLLFGKSGAEILPFLKRYGDQVETVKEGYSQFAENAHQFEISLGKLKAASQGIVNHYVSELLPILIAVIDGIDRFRNIIIAAIVVFGGLPLVTMAATAAYGALSSAMAANAIAAELGMVQTNLLTTSLWGTTVAAQAASGALGALQVVGGVLFAAFAGWQVGSWLSEQFLSAKLAGIAFVDGLLTGWEYIKYGAQVAWEAIKAAFTGAVNIMRNDFADFIAKIASGFAAIGAGDAAQALQGLADKVRPAIGATEDFVAAEAKLAAARDTAVEAVHAITSQMADDAIANDAAKRATDNHAKAKLNFADATGKAAAAGKDFLAHLADQVLKLGLSERALNMLKAAEEGVSQAAQPMIDYIEKTKIAIEEQKEAIKRATEEYKKGEDAARQFGDAAYAAANKSLTDWADGNDKLARQVSLLGDSKLAIDLAAAAEQYRADMARAGYLDSITQTKNYTEAVTREYNRRVDLIRAGAEKQAMLDVIEAEIKAAKEASDAIQKSFEDTSKSINNSLVDALYNGFTHGKSLAEDFKNALINMFKNLVLRPILQPVSDYLAGLYQQGTTSLAGFFGAGGALGSSLGSSDLTGTIGGGALSNWGASTSAPYGGWSGILAGAAIGGAISSQYGSRNPAYGALTGAGVMVGLAGSTGVVATAAAAIATAAGASTAAAATVAAAVPVVGWIVAAVALIASFLVKPGGGPKTGGSSVADFTAEGAASYGRGANPFYTPADRDSDLQKFTASIGKSYFNTIAALGGKASAVSFGIGYDMDPQGTAPNRLGTSVTVGGNQVYGFRDLDLGRDATVLQARMNVEAQRMLLAAVQASNLPADVAHLLNSLAPASLGAEQISNVLAYAAAFHSLPQKMKDALAGITGLEISPATSINLAKFGAAYSAVLKIIDGDPGKDAQAMVDAANQTAMEKFHAQADALRTMATAFDGSADAALNLAQATATYYQNMVQLLAALEQASAAFHKSIMDAERTFNLDILDTAGKQAFYQHEYANQQEILRQAAANPATADPSSVAHAGELARQDLVDWWNTLDASQKATQHDWFINQLNALDDQVTAANRAISDSIRAQNDPNNPNSPIAGVKSAFDKFMLDMNKWLEDNKGVAIDQTSAAQQMSDAAGTMQSAADTQLAAAQTPVVLQYPPPSEVTAGA